MNKLDLHAKLFLSSIFICRTKNGQIFILDYKIKTTVLLLLSFKDSWQVVLLLISENRRNLRITSSYFAYHVNIKREHDTKIKVIVAL